MKVSVIIPFYNAQKYIAETIDSVINQTYENIEIICVDNNSKDGSVNIVQEFIEAGANLILLHESRRGASFARGKGLEKSTGDIIQFLDADDLIGSEKIEKQLNYLLSGNFDMVVSDRSVWNADFSKKLEGYEFSEITINPLEMAIYQVISSGNPLYRKAIVNKVKGYTPYLKSCQDWDFHIKILMTSPKIGYLEGEFFYSRRLSNSLSSNWIEVSEVLAGLFLKYKTFFVKENVFKNDMVAQKIIHTYLQCLIQIKNSVQTELWTKELIYWITLTSGVKPVLTKTDYFIYKIFGIRLFISIKRKLNTIFS